MTSTIDYDALAKQAGAVSSMPSPAKKGKIDYDALAKQAGATDSAPPPTAAPSNGMPTGVIGVPGGGPLPGIPAPPNPISQAKTTVGDYLFGVGKTPQSKRVTALQNETAPGGLDQTIIHNMPHDTANFGKAAVNTVKGTGKAVAAQQKDFWHAPVDEEVGRVVLSPLDAAMGAMGNVGHAASDVTEGHPVAGVSRLAGGNPEQAQESLKQGDVGGYAWNMFGQPAALTAGAELAAKTMGGIQNAARGERFANNNLAKIIAPGFKGDVLPQYAAAELGPYFQQEAAAAGLKDENFIQRMFTGDTPSRSTIGGKGKINETIEGMTKIRKIADGVVSRIDNRVNGPNGVMAQAEHDPVPPQTKANILSDLRSEQAETAKVNKKLAAAYDPLIESINNAQTFGDINNIKKASNNAIEGMFNASPSENAALSVEPIIASKRAGQAIREHMYPDLQKYVAPQGTPGWFSVADTGRLEGQAMDARDGIYANYKASGHANLSDVSKKYLESLTEGSMYKTHLLRRGLKILPTPAGEFNKTFRRSIGKLGEGTTPESVAVKKQQLKLPAPSAPGAIDLRGGAVTISPYNRSGVLPSSNIPRPPTYPGRFDVPTGVPAETTTGAPQVTPQQVYLGKRTVPNPNFSPMEGPSHLQQEQELGSTAHTIPDRVRGAQTPARVRADQVGVGHVPHPDSGAAPRTLGGLNPPPVRSITGPQTVEASNWQYLTGAKEPPQTITRNGAAVMRTGNPEIAQVALDDMRKFAGSKEFKALPKSEQILHRDTLSKLEGQMKEYQKWKAKNPVAPPPGKEPEFEVWLNPGVAGKVNQAKGKLTRRVAAHTARAIGQAGIQKNAGNTEDDMKAITDEQERRMSQPE